uniref:Uncharacterized protein n=1 Tax=Leersia perrieri TaxID=77586 RepID=A0A0D9X869_9ORYZ
MGLIVQRCSNAELVGGGPSRIGVVDKFMGEFQSTQSHLTEPDLGNESEPEFKGMSNGKLMLNSGAGMDPSEGRSEGQILGAAIDESKVPIVEKKKKTKMVRYTQEQISYCIANPKELSDLENYPKLTEGLSKEFLAEMPPELLARMDNNAEERKARWKKLKDDLHHEREVIYGIPDKVEDVLKQYYSKGYAEIH